MAQLIKPPRRFTHEEWAHSNNLKYRFAEKERELAQGLQDESDRLMDETEKRTERTLKDVDKKIEQRIDDVKYWKSEVNKKLDDVTEETDKLNETQSRLRRALEATDEPLHIAQQCLISREDRKGIDLVHDDVEKELRKEIEVFQGVQALLQKTMEQVKEQLRLNRKAIYNLKKDSSDKLAAQHVDEYAKSLKATDASLPGSQKPPKIDSDTISAEEWQAYSTDSIEAGDKQLQNSQELRSLIDSILQQVAADQQRQVAATNRAFRRRISETRSAKGKLEEHLAEVLKEISKVEDLILELNKAIKDKEGALRLTGTRIDVRRERPDLEQVRDSASYRLVEEVAEITNDIAQLHTRLDAAHASLKALCRRQLDLEEEIQIKTTSLFIDEVQCLGIRDSIHIVSF